MKLFKNLSPLNFQLLTFLLTVIISTSPVKAQVTIGDNVTPHKFSILELTTENKDGGLRLPQLTTEERDELNFASNPDAAQGLVIYNKTTNCLEFWNGNEWISLCSDARVDCSSIVFPSLGSSYTFCSGATFADLTTSAGGNVKWYNTETGGNAYDPSSTLTNGAIYYAEQSISGCTSPQRTAVTVTTGDCSKAIINPDITAYVNVMYDFQHQTLEAYWDPTGGIPINYEWQVSTSSDGSFQDIAGALNSNQYSVPPNFATDWTKDADVKTDSLFFRCLVSNSITTTPMQTSVLNILFLRTASSGYDKDPNGVRYLTINRGGNLNNGKINVALLNLGQSGTGSLNPDPRFDDSRNLNDAGDLGDFYQWGRAADGYQHTVWSKQRISTAAIGDGNSTASYAFMSNWFGLRSGWGAAGATSAVVTRVAASQVYDSNGQIDPSNTGFYGNFISSGGDWGAQAAGNYDLWGNGVNSRAGSPTSLDGAIPWVPKAQANNPCPSGWRVPSRFEVWDIYRGDGSSVVDAGVSTGCYVSTGDNQNAWSWRGGANNAIGGVIITNSSGEKVFLPAVGTRLYDGGELFQLGDYGGYWTSTYSTPNQPTMYAVYLNFTPYVVSAGNTNANVRRSYGLSVRCVSE